MPKKKVRGTYEWASYTANCATGCPNNCIYCYARTKTIRAGKRNPETWKDETLMPQAFSKEIIKRAGTTMFPTLHDITPSNLAACAVYLERLLSVGNKVLIVSKPRPECIKFLCNVFTPYKDQILFRFTIGSANNDVLRLWEPDAPCFEERLKALKIAYSLGYETSVSCEPMLDDDIQVVVRTIEDYITDAIWLGKANKLIERLTTNGASDDILKHGIELIRIQNDNNIKGLYESYKDHPKIKWKESIKEVVGLEVPTKKGLDV
jgi:DNA repair photolyase